MRSTNEPSTKGFTSRLMQDYD
ncbi:hypothetical protein PF010_g27827, partial [Phytophthora fragariae]